MAKPHYEEIQSKSILNRVRGMDFRWSINPYKGCVHSCHYCFARRYHSFVDLSAGDDFSSIIFVKINAPSVLRAELAKPSWRRDVVVVGTATDPYQPIEGRYRLTRGILEALRDYRTPVSLITKGSMIVRDADVLSQISRRAGCTVNFSVTTMDEKTWRKLEPGTPPPWKRLLAMQRLVEAGVNAGVLLAPVVPGITDDYDTLDAVVQAAAVHKARFITATPLRLQPLVREHFHGFLREEYPHLLSRYQRTLPSGYTSKRYRRRLEDVMGALRTRYGLANERQLDPPADAPRQLAFALSP